MLSDEKHLKWNKFVHIVHQFLFFGLTNVGRVYPANIGKTEKQKCSQIYT